MKEKSAVITDNVTTAKKATEKTVQTLQTVTQAFKVTVSPVTPSVLPLYRSLVRPHLEVQ